VIAAAATGLPLTVDLEAQTIYFPHGSTITFGIDAHRRRALLLGLDQIGAILADDAAEIAAFEGRQKTQAPWLYLDKNKLSTFNALGKILKD
jgi:3-isopropylmalate/(R)-2-methylmalate dehydratase small subunit